MSQASWRDLSPAYRRTIIVAGTVQISLAAAAWTDLVRRRRELVRGPKPLWAAVIAINFVGPVAYLVFGRRPAEPAVPEVRTLVPD